jgi:hypothetical protein
MNSSIKSSSINLDSFRLGGRGQKYCLLQKIVRICSHRKQKPLAVNATITPQKFEHVQVATAYSTKVMYMKLG